MGMAMTDRELGPGERTALARERRLRNGRTVIVAAILAVVVLLPAAHGLIDGLSGAPHHAPAWMRSAGASAVIAAVIVGGLMQWREHDEVIRRRAINAFAVTGVIGLVGYPLFGVLGLFGAVAQPDTLWAVAVVGGAAAYLYQHWRDNHER